MMGEVLVHDMIWLKEESMRFRQVKERECAQCKINAGCIAMDGYVQRTDCLENFSAAVTPYLS